MSLLKAIRFANEYDCENILNIYKPYILESTISFETEIPSIQDFTERFKEITTIYPWLVYVENDRILGYAYGSPHRSRHAYNWSSEVTVYVDKLHHKKGIGTLLYKSLFSILKQQGFYNLFAGITQPNDGSNQTHTKLGFKKIGTYRNIGYKFSTWHDVSWYQLEINSGSKPCDPTPITKFLEVNI